MRYYNPILSYPGLELNPQKPIAIYVWHEIGLGDNMFLTPIIKKLSNIYNEKITLFLPTPKIQNSIEFFKNNPYVEKIIRVNDVEDGEVWEDVLDKYDIYIVYDNNWNDYSFMDMRQMAAAKIGITLKEDEMDIDFFPDPYIEIEELPEKYICINPYISGVDRTWEKEKWQDLVDKLNYDGIYVVSIGMGEKDINYYDLDIKLGVNLCNKECQNNLSQTWHILNKSDIFITFSCSIYVLAASTNTHIMLLGWYSDPYYQLPVRNGIRGYKCDVVDGSCDVYCSTDPRFDVKEFGTMRRKHRVQICMLDRNWICKPTSNKVYNKIKEILE